MKIFLCRLNLIVWAAMFATPVASFGQEASVHTNAIPTGPLARLDWLATKRGIEDELPANLAGLLWPDKGNGKQKCGVKKILIPGKHEGEGRVLFVRTDNHDLVLMQHSESVDGDSKTRQEMYYRTTNEGNLVLALSATLQSAKDEADNDVLKKVNLQTYGRIAGDGTKLLPITPEITTKFAAEKKFWLEQEKKYRKAASRQKQ
jgi:hypothetical protein